VKGKQENGVGNQ